MQKYGWCRINGGAEYSAVCSRTFRDFLKMGLRHVRLPSGTILIAYSDIDEFLRRFEVLEKQEEALVEEILKEMKD
jgi:hypothetical protein